MAARLPYPFARPLLPPVEEWAPLLARSYDERWFSNGGPLVRDLEARLGALLPERRGVLVSSATAGLTAALLALGVRGRVAAPAFTFPATIHAIELAGCEPVLCDIDEATWELDPAAARRAVERLDCAAIVHVRAFGLCRNLDAIEQTARELGVPLVVDAAAAWGGTEPDGRLVGQRGDAEVFSFHATKVFGIGEGGYVAARRDLVPALQAAINFAIDGSDVTGRALNGKLPEPAAAIGLAMLDHIDEHLAVRRAACEHLAPIAERAGCTTPSADVGTPPWQCLPLLVSTSAERDALLDRLAERGLEGRAYYCPGLHRSTAWRDRAPDPLPATDAVAARLLCLPLYSDLAGNQLDYVGGLVEEALQEPLSGCKAA